MVRRLNPLTWWRRFVGWLVPTVPDAIRPELERRQLLGIQHHVPMIYLVASLNVAIIMAVCARAGIAPRYYAWMSSLVVLALVRTVSWARTRREALAPQVVSKALRGSAWLAFISMAGMGAFTSVTYVTGVFERSTLIPISLAFGSMSIAHCFATLRPTAVASLTLGIAPSSLALLAVGDFNARVLGVSMLSVAGLMIHFVAVQFDHLVLELQLQREVHDLANTDALTHLHNRRALVRVVEQELARGPGNTFALALLDLDGFKDVNDRLGHLTGDALLQVVAQRLVASCGPTATVGRLGGDEFVVVFHAVRGEPELAARVSALLQELCQPTELSGETVPVRASLGSALFPRDGDSTPALLAAADAALYANKAERTRTGERVAPTATHERRKHRA
ncbi:MAG: diguanylate cyclase domain-containing protein [Myxococcota bacterium]